jgi:hypothetical protein
MTLPTPYQRPTNAYQRGVCSFPPYPPWALVGPPVGRRPHRRRPLPRRPPFLEERARRPTPPIERGESDQ